MKKKNRRQAIIFFSIVAVAAVLLIIRNNLSNRENEALRQTLLAAAVDLEDTGGSVKTYESYLRAHAEAIDQASPIPSVKGDEYTDATDPDTKTEENYVASGPDGSLTYTFEVENAGFYEISVRYYPTADSTAAIQRSILINGILPFAEAEDIQFSRMWQDEEKTWLMQTESNQAVPSQIQNPDWREYCLEASEKTVTGPLHFYFESGENTVTFQGNGGTMVIAEVALLPAEDLISYADYIAGWEEKGAERVSAKDLPDGRLMVQAEDTLYKSASSLIPENDRTSSQTVPYHPSNIVLNTIGGSSWSDVGVSITWAIEVPKSGLYQLALRYMQAENRDFYSIREVKINGEIPFAEAAGFTFPYNNNFVVAYLGGEDTWFYLEEGTNTLTMTVTMGNLSYAFAQSGISVTNFNSLYRRFVAVMGSTPDEYRDYRIVSSIPDMVEILKTEYCRLTSVMESLGESLGNNGKTRAIGRLLYQMEGIINRPDSIAKELALFNSNVTAVSEWRLSLGEQPLQLDYLLVCGEGSVLPKARDNFAEGLAHSLKAFAASFTNNYRILPEGTKDKTEKTDLEVWIATSTRDQYDIAQRMINKAFSNSSINIELKMVNADTVMPATLTGNGPDVAIQLNYSMPTNFAWRSAAYDLTQFDDYEEIAAGFAPDVLNYFTYEGGQYALPDQMSFPVMYYRTDILEEMGLSIPETWDELLGILPYLQAQNMEAYFVTTGYTTLGGYSSTSTKPVNAVFLSKLYQNGEELYKDGGMSTGLDTLGALLTFRDWTEYYTKQGFATSMSVVTRFRTGECPIIIEDYTYMNSISAAAPEIEGSWSIAPIPGTRQADGTIRRDTAAMVSAAMILKTSVEAGKNAEEAWEFLKWWVSDQTQTNYAAELEALLGDGGNFPVASLNALRSVAQSRRIEGAIDIIIENLRGVSQVPGGYISGRTVENAFLSVIDDNSDPVDTLYNQLRFINAELTSKRQEFGLPTAQREEELSDEK